ncbi:MAG: hypothetical protein HYY03_07720 [Chloroflexi bacterium]|nr:hypothetical protein [Chloroflexota bacterium]
MRKVLPLTAAALVAVTAATLLLAGCGDNGEKTIGTLTLTATDFAFDVQGDPKPGPISITMPNDGEYEHHAQFFRIEDGHTMDELLEELEQLSDEDITLPEWAVWVGGPGILSPGETAELFVDFEAGHYAFLCLLDDPDGVPHTEKGMRGEITIEGEENTASLPAADVEITGEDDGTGQSYAFGGLPDSIEAGEAVVEFRNDGSEPHELQIARVPDELTVEDVLRIFFEEVEPPEEFEYVALGGPQVMLPGDSTRARINLQSGRYVFICFVPNAEGVPHAALGMAAQLDVRP